MKKTIEERYEVRYFEAALYWVRWLMVWCIGTLILLYSLTAEDLDENFKLLFMLIGIGFIVQGTMISSGCYMLKGMWINFFNDIGWIKKYKYNFHDLSEALANFPMVFALMYFIITLTTMGEINHGWLLKVAMWLFILPYGITIIYGIINLFLNMGKKKK